MPILLLALAACGPDRSGEPPSVLLVVIDTLRADAVSAYGEVEGTTPYLDALARDGLRYTRAFANAPWTLPSHASLFTGRRPDRDRVGVDGVAQAPDSLTSLAELMRAAGWETAGFSENPFVSPAFNLAQGFEHYASNTFTKEGLTALDVRAELARFLETRDRTRPFFVFVNLLDPHEPYVIRDDNPYLPSGVDAEQARAVSQSPFRICDDLPAPGELEVLRALYLSDVQAADAKLADVRTALVEAAGGAPLITVVTSDHGEHLGEHRLLGHQYSVRHVLLHVPLVVEGLPEVAPAVIDAPVALIDVVPSILLWTGLPVPVGLDGTPLPTVPQDGWPERSVVGVYSNFPPFDWPEGQVLPPIRAVRRDAGCDDTDRVFGNMVTVTRWPYKAVWHDRYEPELFDLSRDPGEEHDLAAGDATVPPPMQEALQRAVDDVSLKPFESIKGSDLQPEVARALRALGYIP